MLSFGQRSGRVKARTEIRSCNVMLRFLFRSNHGVTLSLRLRDLIAVQTSSAKFNYDFGRRIQASTIREMIQSTVT